MFGNLQGWIVAAVMALLIGFGVWQVSKINGITPATALSKSPTAMKTLELSVSPMTVVAMDKGGDATAEYHAAIDDIRRNTSKYDDAVADNDVAKLKALPAVKAAVASAGAGRALLLSRRLDENVGYSTQDAEDLKAVILLGKCLEIAGVLSVEKDAAGAAKLFEAQFALGHRMFAERVNYWEGFFGIGQMRTAAAGLLMIAEKKKDQPQIDKIKAFSDSAGELIDKQLMPMWKVLGAVDKKLIDKHAGDVFAFTGPEMKERMWRVESILKLGRHKYNVSRLADQTIVPYRLDDLRKSDKDPVVLTAVEKADALTLQDYRMIK